MNSVISLATAKKFRDKQKPWVKARADRDRKAKLRDEAFQSLRPSLGVYDGEEWAEWLVKLFLPRFIDKQNNFTGFAEVHAEWWRWVFGIEKETDPDPFLKIIFREGGKSTNVEMACVYVGGERLRNYGWYICGTQSQADDHVANISGLMQSPLVGQKYPHLAKAAIDDNGRSLGWRASRLSTRPEDSEDERQRGFTIDAIGLDKAVRGGRLDEDRPDFIMFDDIDDEHDTVRAVEKKIQRLSQTFLPAAASNVAIAFVQNIPNPNGVAAKLVDNDAGILSNRKLSGPHPAIKDLAYTKGQKPNTAEVTGGTPTWGGFGLQRAQKTIDRIGLNAFLVEYQHERTLAGGLFLSGIWHSSVHVIKPFEIPTSWYIDRSFDWGSSKPYSVGWWAESDGETPIEWGDGKLRYFPKGSLFLIRELYGWNGNPNQGVRHSAREIAKRIKEVESKVYWGSRVKDGPADSSIYNAEDDETDSIAQRMEKAGVGWEKANKKPGSRVDGAAKIVEMLWAATVSPIEDPCIYVFDECEQAIRTLPILPKDPTNPDDVDTDSEDHIWDKWRYRVLHKRSSFGVANTTGH